MSEPQRIKPLSELSRFSTAYLVNAVKFCDPRLPDYDEAIVGYTKHKHPYLVHLAWRWNRLVNWVEEHADNWHVHTLDWEPEPIYDEVKKAEIDAALEPLVYTWGRDYRFLQDDES